MNTTLKHLAELMIEHAIRAGVSAQEWRLGRTMASGVPGFAIFEGADDNNIVYVLPPNESSAREMLYAMAYAYDTTVRGVR